MTSQTSKMSRNSMMMMQDPHELSEDIKWPEQEHEDNAEEGSDFDGLQG